MNPIKFKEQNMTFNAGAEWGELPAYRDEHEIISCFKMSFIEKLHILFHSKVWVSVLGYSQPPIAIMGKTPFVKAGDPK